MTDKTDREIMQQALDAMMDAMRVSGGISDKMFESVNAISERLAQPDPRNQCGETCERAKLCAVCLAEMGEQLDPQHRRIALDLEELHLKAKQRAEKEAALSYPEGNNRKKLQEELTDRYYYEYTGGRK